MDDDLDHTTQPRPRPIDIALVIIGATVLASLGIPPAQVLLWQAALGFVAGCALGAVAWWWPRVAGPGLLVLSIPGMAHGLFFVLYTRGMLPDLVALWGAVAFLVGAVGVLRRRSAARRPRQHLFVQAGLVGSLAAAFLLYSVFTWPPQGKAILLSLPIVEQAAEPRVWASYGGYWTADWAEPRVSLPEALDTVKRSIESDGWTIVDSSLRGDGTPLISAQRGAYSLLVIYTYPDIVGGEPEGDMAVYVRRGPAQLINEPNP